MYFTWIIESRLFICWKPLSVCVLDREGEREASGHSLLLHSTPGDPPPPAPFRHGRLSTGVGGRGRIRNGVERR